MTTFFGSSLALAFVCSLVVAVGLHTALFASDRAGASVPFAVVCGIRWLSIAGSLIALAAGARFGWISPSPAIQGTVVMIAHLLMGICSMFAVGWALEENRSPGALFTADLAAVAVPIVTLAYLAVLSFPSQMPLGEAITRKGALFALAISVGILLILGMNAARSSSLAAAKKEEAAQSEDDQIYAGRLAHLEQVQLSGSLESVLDMTGRHEPRDVSQRALVALQSRADLPASLPALLRSAEPALVLRFFLEANVAVTPEIAHAARDAVVKLGAWLKHQIPRVTDDFLKPITCSSEAALALAIAEKCKSSSTDFAPAIIEVREALGLLEDRRTLNGEPVAEEARRSLDNWLDSNLASASKR